MNANKNMKINFLINGELDHTIQPKKGKSIKNRPTKTRKTFKYLNEKKIAEYMEKKNKEAKKVNG